VVVVALTLVLVIIPPDQSLPAVPHTSCVRRFS
jgi:hypothetical protein